MMSGEMAGQMAARSSHFKSVLISLNLFVLVGKKLLSSSFSANALLSMTCHTFSHNPKSASNRSMMRLMSTSCLPLLIAAANPNNERDALSSALFTALVRLTRCFKTLPPGPEVAGFLLLAFARAVTPARAIPTRSVPAGALRFQIEHKWLRNHCAGPGDRGDGTSWTKPTPNHPWRQRPIRCR